MGLRPKNGESNGKEHGKMKWKQTEITGFIVVLNFG